MGNILDKTVAWLSPEAGYKRERYRRALGEERNYDAAGYGRGNANWRAVNESAEITDRYGRDTVRARARDLERNSDILNAVTGAFKRNVFGAGYRLRVLTGDDELNRQIEKMWGIWCKARNCDVTGTQSFNAMMRMAIIRKKVDGGILIVKRITKEGCLPLSLQMLEVDELDINHMVPHSQGNKVVGGIEYNSYNRPMGYFISTYQIDGSINTEPVYIEAKDVIFWFTKTRPSQVREMSDMSPTVTRVRDTNEFIKAVSIKERILACLAVFVKKLFPPSGMVGGRFGKNLENEITHDYQGKTLTPGMIMNLNQGDEVQVVNPSGQSTDATAYTKQQVRLIGAGQGLSYETVSRDMSESNYSSARQGGIEDELTYQEDVEALMEIMDEVYESFVISCVMANKVDITDFWDHKEQYLSHKWIKAPKKWIDPAKEANANKTALYTGQKTWGDLAAEQGKDWKEMMDEMAQIIEYGQSKGINMAEVMFGNGKVDKNAEGKQQAE